MLCPCSSSKAYDKCCKPLHQKLQAAKSAAQLMRSRFSAFSLGSQNIEPKTMASYIEHTCHENLREQQKAESLLLGFQQTHWQGLYVIASQEASTTASVEFVAFFSEQNSDTIQQLHEFSTFEKNDSRWLYKSGKILSHYNFKRNQPCWCNSGRKFKHCHGQ